MKFCEYGENYGYEYIELIRKSDMKQVYTSPAYHREDCNDVYDYSKIKSALNYYFDRVNSAINAQLANDKVPAEKKAELKLLDKNDFYVQSTYCLPIGYMKHPVNWKKDAQEFL